MEQEKLNLQKIIENLGRILLIEVKIKEIDFVLTNILDRVEDAENKNIVLEFDLGYFLVLKGTLMQI